MIFGDISTICEPSERELSAKPHVYPKLAGGLLCAAIFDFYFLFHLRGFQYVYFFRFSKLFASFRITSFFFFLFLCWISFLLVNQHTIDLSRTKKKRGSIDMNFVKFLFFLKLFIFSKSSNCTISNCKLFFDISLVIIVPIFNETKTNKILSIICIDLEVIPEIIAKILNLFCL